MLPDRPARQTSTSWWMIGNRADNEQNECPAEMLRISHGGLRRFGWFSSSWAITIEEGVELGVALMRAEA